MTWIAIFFAWNAEILKNESVVNLSVDVVTTSVVWYELMLITNFNTIICLIVTYRYTM